jgi:aspartate aminotransferase
MPGWRLGYAAGPEKLISSMTSLQDHMSSNPCSISQMAALEAIDGEQNDVKIMLEEFTTRRNYIVENINKLPLIKCAPPKGAFYSFIDISETKLDSMTFAGRLLEEELVAIIPGIAFGMDNFVRLSFASSFEDIKKGIERMGNFLRRL